MANRHRRSRSPIRSLRTTPRFNSESALPRWVGPPGAAAQALSHPEPAADEPLLACPECGTGLRIRLTAVEAAPRPSPSLLPPPPADPEPLPDFEAAVREHKRFLLSEALARNGGVMIRAAKALGLKYTTFVAMVHRLGVLEEGPEQVAE